MIYALSILISNKKITSDTAPGSGAAAKGQEEQTVDHCQYDPVDKDKSSAVVGNHPSEQLYLDHCPHQGLQGCEYAHPRPNRRYLAVVAAAHLEEEQGQQQASIYHQVGNTGPQQPGPHHEYGQVLGLVHTYGVGLGQGQEEIAEEEGEVGAHDDQYDLARFGRQFTSVVLFIRLPLLVIPRRIYMLQRPVVDVLGGHRVSCILLLRRGLVGCDAGRGGERRLIWLVGLLGEKFEDVVVNDNLFEDNFFPAEGAVGFDPEAIDAGLADGVVHGADNEGDIDAAVVGAEADVALVDGPLEFLSDASPHNYLYLSVDDMQDHHLICNRKIIS